MVSLVILQLTYIIYQEEPRGNFEGPEMEEAMRAV